MSKRTSNTFETRVATTELFDAAFETHNYPGSGIDLAGYALENILIPLLACAAHRGIPPVGLLAEVFNALDAVYESPARKAQIAAAAQAAVRAFYMAEELTDGH